MIVPLAGMAMLLCLGAAHEWLGGASATRKDRSWLAVGGEAALGKLGWLDARAAPLGGRLRAAGLDRLPNSAVLAAKLAGAVAVIPTASALAPAAPGRTGIGLVALAIVGMFFAPDVFLAHLARKRGAAIRAELPGVLDLMATAAEAGRGIPGLLEIGVRGCAGPLRDELISMSAALDCGDSQRSVLERLRQDGGDLGKFAVTMQRSRRLGSPLAVGLRAQASSLREGERRAIGERGARAAPKIQLVVALVLVPSVLLMVAAAIAAHSSSITSGL